MSIPDPWLERLEEIPLLDIPISDMSGVVSFYDMIREIEHKIFEAFMLPPDKL
jgi:hypothetical protein